LQNLSNDFKNTIENVSKEIEELSEYFNSSENMFLLGKGSDEYVAKEGSLKIKEISYIHSEGYSASSLKHGPFALLNVDFPVILLNLDSAHRTKIMNCFEEIHSRNAAILMITNETNNESIEGKCKKIVLIDNPSYSSLLGVVPLQLLAYYLSVKRNINPDKPKNLAKVVTVE
jgi:glucosamine--fructose-6-phosphate aminotransferase (isomerizing)